MDVTLYKNFSVENTLGKNKTQVAKYAGVQLVEPTDDNEVTIRMTVPTSTLRWSNVNYFEWDGAFYFLESVDLQANGISVINGRMDVLETYSTAVKDLVGTVARSTSHGSMRIEDANRHVTVDSERTVLAFPNSISGSEGMGVYIVTTSQTGFATT